VGWLFGGVQAIHIALPQHHGKLLGQGLGDSDLRAGVLERWVRQACSSAVSAALGRSKSQQT
jgi:hypothetical protein